MKRAIAAMVVFAGACSAGAPTPKAEPPVERSSDRPIDTQPGSVPVTDMTKKPHADSGAFVRGPAVTPAAALITWLDGQKLDGQPRLVRLPVILQREQVGFSTRGARIGEGADTVELYVNDSALGIGVAQQARSMCPTAATCALWLEGYWRGMQDDAYTFDVRTIKGPIAADALASANYAEVQGESGN